MQVIENCLDAYTKNLGINIIPFRPSRTYINSLNIIFKIVPILKIAYTNEFSSNFVLGLIHYFQFKISKFF